MMNKIQELTVKLEQGLKYIETLGQYNKRNLAIRKRQDDAIKTFHLYSVQLASEIVGKQHGLNEVEVEALKIFEGNYTQYKGGSY